MGRSNEQALRRFLACRRAGDEAGALQAWTAVVEQEHDRLQGMVAAWAAKGRLSAAEQEDAYALALRKFGMRMLWTFDGSSMGELINALRTCATYACQETQRQAAKHSKKQVALEVVDDAGEQRLHDGVAQRTMQEHDAAAADEREAEGFARDQAFLAWALPQVTETRRAVLERDLDGMPAEAIAAELGISMDNLYQRRTRGHKDLRKLKEQWDG